MPKTTVLAVAFIATSIYLQGISPQAYAADQNPYDAPVHEDVAQATQIRESLFNNVKPENIRQNLITLTAKPHMTGTAENMQLMDLIQQRYTDMGFDKVVASEYEILLGYPDFSRPNTVEARTSNQAPWRSVSHGLGTPLGPPEAQRQQANPKGKVWYVAYSPSGTVVSRMVYANRGYAADFDYLASRGIPVRGSIVLLREFSNLWEAINRGAAGVVLYFDPANPLLKPPAGLPRNDTFPHSMYFPATDIIRLQKIHRDRPYGDLLTDFYPAKPWAFRQFTAADLRRQGILPKVPVAMISQNDAKALFREMDGLVAPAGFAGQLPGTTYKLNSIAATFRLTVNAITDDRRPIRNVCAYLYGKSESDREVLLTNHVDAVDYGAFDPNSGTAAILEIARSLMQTVHSHHWRPRRTMVFCNWDAEEMGLMGSNEWMEEHYQTIQAKAVAVINVDVNVEGNTTLVALGLPLLYKSMVDSAKLVANPSPAEVAQGRTRMYDSWLHYLPSVIGGGVPLVLPPAPDSDHYPFLAYAGVPATTFTYVCLPGCYAIFHTMYDIEWTMEHLVDPGFRINTAVAKFWLEIGRALADTLVIPFNIEHYAAILNIYLSQMDNYIKANGLSSVIPDYATTLSGLHEAMQRFTAAGAHFHALADPPNSGHGTITLRQAELLNKRLVDLERCFINPRGLYPERQMVRHVVFGLPHVRPPGVTTFPAVIDAVQYYLAALHAGDIPKGAKWLRQLRLSIDDVRFSLESAILTLDLSRY